MTRGLNRNYNRELKDVFKGAATAATGRPGPLQDFYEGMIARGMREELARVTLTRKLAAQTGEFGITANYIQPGAIMTPASREVFRKNKDLRDFCIRHSAARRLGEPRANRRERRLAITCLAHDVDVRFHVQQFAQRAARQRFVIDDQCEMGSHYGCSVRLSDG